MAAGTLFNPSGFREAMSVANKDVQGRSQDFSEGGGGGGGVTVCQSEGTHQTVISFSPLVVGCLLKKAQKGGVTGTPGSLATPLSFPVYKVAIQRKFSQINTTLKFSMPWFVFRLS